MFKVIIAGGRDFDDYSLLEEKCKILLADKHPNIIVVSGTAKGADKLGEVFATYSEYKIKRFKALWDNLDVTPCLIRQNSHKQKYNALAGNNRNKLMGEYCDAGIIFNIGGKGTADMIRIMKKLNKPVRIIKCK